MKYAILVGDGMGDYSIPELGGRTPLEAAHTPNMDALAQGGLLGLAQTIPPDKEPGSDVANMAIMGYDPELYHTGRGPLEAASLGIELKSEELAFRLNLVTLDFKDDGRVIMRDHSAGHISSQEAAGLIEHLSAKLPLRQGQRLYPGVSYRHLLTWPDLPDGLPTIAPHDYRDQEVTEYLKGNVQEMRPLLDLVRASWSVLRDHPINQARVSESRRPANSIWPWGQGRPPAMPTYQERWGLSGAVVSAVDLIKGLGVYAGLKPLEVPGANGLIDTNYQGKVQATLKTLEQEDFALVHIEAPDEAGHQGDLETKIKAIELFDQLVVGPIWAGLKDLGKYRLMVLCDHFTPLSVKTHTREPVPFLIHPGARPSGRSYTEAQAALAGLYFNQGHHLVDLLFGDQE